MTPQDVLAFFTPLDAAALGLLLLAWIGVARAIEAPHSRRPSVSFLMERYRHDWMRAYVTRAPRVFDMMALGNLRQGTAFFASSCLIAIGGGLALVANPQTLRGFAQDLSLETAPILIWELKMLLILLFLASALFKFIWSHRLFGYCAVVMSAAPNDDSPRAYHHAEQAADIANSAARSFNRGLRAIYFSLGAAAWLVGPVPLILATLATVAVLWRREFNSRSREILLRKAPE